MHNNRPESSSLWPVVFYHGIYCWIALQGSFGSSHLCCFYLNPLGPAFRPAGKKIPTAGLTTLVPFTAPPPVTMFSTCVVSRAKAITLVGSASVMRVAVTAVPPPRDTLQVAAPYSR